MFAPSTEATRHIPVKRRGFTMVELVVVITILGVISVSVLPKLGAIPALRNDAWLDEVVAAVRYARQTAISHRRLVCLTVGSSSLSLQIASAHPATSCNTDLRGPNGTAVFASGISTGATLNVSPAYSNLIYFLPDGRIASDGNATVFVNRTIAMADAPASTITLFPETGHVEVN